MTDDRKWAERKVGLARLWARTKQVLTTDPTGSDEDDLVVDEEAARVLAAQAGRLKGGLAKVAQLAAYDPGATLGRGRGASAQARAVLGGLWDSAPAMSAGAIAAVVEQDLGKAPQALYAQWDPAPLASASIGQVHAARSLSATTTTSSASSRAPRSAACSITTRCARSAMLCARSSTTAPRAPRR